MINHTLKPITESRSNSTTDLLNDALSERITLYTVLKNNITVYYDYIEVNNETIDGLPCIGVAERDHEESFSRYDVIPLPLEAIKRLWTDRKLEGQHAELIFSPPTAYHRTNIHTSLPTIELTDVYVDTASNRNPPSRKAKGPTAEYILAIHEAVSSLGKKASNERIFAWIKNQATNPPNDLQHILNALDFDDDDISPFSTTSQQAVILKYNNKPITKKTFQNQCGEAKK